jgi:sugar (pentulose or hexulose) kinase
VSPNTPRSDQVFIGLDLGTSGLKGVAMAADGALVATASSGYATARPLPGRAEQDPAGWWDAVEVVVGSLSRDMPVERWAGLGLSGMLPTLVLADADGAPVGPAITWEDDRADPDGERFRAGAGEDAVYRETGQWVDGRYLLPMFRWIEREEPARAERATWILGAKDHLFFRLTGEVATDPSTATGFGCYSLSDGRWSQALAGRAGTKLPPVEPTSFTSALSPDAADALGVPSGIPVYLGAADSVCGGLGAGATGAGDRVSLWGTSTAIIGVSADLVLDQAHRYLVTPLALGDAWGLEMDLVSTGSAIAWIAELLGVDEAVLLELAATSPPGANGTSFLPYLGFGEQGALWDPALRGTIGHLTLAHTRADVARALLEGIALEVRRCARVLDEAGVAPGPLVVAGAAAGSETFAGMLAGATGGAITRVEDGRWISARGAAIVAAVGAGAIDAADVAPPKGSTLEPRSVEAATWDELAERHDILLRRVRSR